MAIDDIATTIVEAAVTTLNVFANDIADEEVDLSIRSFTQPGCGEVSYNNDGTFRYTPDPGFSGQDRFTYMVSGKVTHSNSETVSIRVLSHDEVALEVVAGGVRFLRAIIESITGGLPRNKTRQSQLDSSHFPAEDFLYLPGSVL